MPNQRQFDRAALSAVKPGIDMALGGVVSRLKQYFDDPVKHADVLEKARGEMHRVVSVLRMIRLSGEAVYCEEIERLLNELGGYDTQESPLYNRVLNDSLAGLDRYLGELMQGEANNALRLFPSYQAMQQLRGMEVAFEQDLFFPDLSVSLPDSVLKIAQPADAANKIKASQTRYQRGLLLCLHENNVSEAVKMMQQATDVVLACMPQDDSREIWWVAGSLLDCIKANGLTSDRVIRKLLGRIDRQLRAINKAGNEETPALISEMLYLIGHSKSTSRRSNQIKRHYALQQYFPDLILEDQPALFAPENGEIWAELADRDRGADESVLVYIGDIELSAELFNIFSVEATQLVAALRTQFNQMCMRQPLQVRFEFMRCAHTLAEISRSLGFVAMEALSAAFEGWLLAHLEKASGLDDRQLQMLDKVIAALKRMVEQVCARQMPLEQRDLVALVLADENVSVEHVEKEKEGRGVTEPPASKEDAVTVESVPIVSAEPVVPDISESRQVHEVSIEQTGNREEAADLKMHKVGLAADEVSLSVSSREQIFLQVQPEVFDSLLKQSGKISKVRAQMEVGLNDIRAELGVMRDSVAGWYKQLSEVEYQEDIQMRACVSATGAGKKPYDQQEFDRLAHVRETIRFMTESLLQMQQVQQSLQNKVDEAVSAVQLQAQLSHELRQNLMEVQRVPFSRIGERLHRIVWHYAQQQNKRVSLKLAGDIRMGSARLDRLIAPLELLLCNAIEHAREDEPSRIKFGAESVSEIRLIVRRENDEVIIELSDNGQGLDLFALRDQAIKKGLLEADDDTVSDHQLAQLIFSQDITSAGNNRNSIRGLSSALREVAALGGRINAYSGATGEARFVVHLPDDSHPG